MPTFPEKSLARLRLCILIAVMALAGCNKAPVEPVDPAAAVEAERAEQAAQAAAASTSVLPDLNGVWEVTGVHAGQSPVQQWKNDDPMVMASSITVTKDIVSWTLQPGGDFPSSDACNGPRLEAIQDSKAMAETLNAEFVPALAQFGMAGDAGQVFFWLCSQGGNWGPAGGARMMISPDTHRIVMAWHDGVYLKLSRVKG